MSIALARIGLLLFLAWLVWLGAKSMESGR
jgi:hypothetical protein